MVGQTDGEIEEMRRNDANQEARLKKDVMVSDWKIGKKRRNFNEKLARGQRRDEKKRGKRDEKAQSGKRRQIKIDE